MEGTSRVSVWLGSFDNEEQLNAYVEEQFDEEGNVSSAFMRDFGIDFIDSQFQEVLFSRELKRDDIAPASYSESFLDEIAVDFSRYNSLILLYNFSYDKTVDRVGRLAFIGVYDYTIGE
ncbi:MAG: hypothetical protein CSA07_01145 [Bacteroidia bacterium]|nr:MAG: hypothetical protein CSA07_01145 [Bacteroidia bacterium]